MKDIINKAFSGEFKSANEWLQELAPAQVRAQEESISAFQKHQLQSHKIK